MDEIRRYGFLLHTKTNGFKFRVERSKKIIAEALASMQKGYIAFSTGKDSLVTYHLVKEQCPSIAAVYFDADCAFPESYELLERYPGVIRWKCEPLLDTFERLGGPTAQGIGKATMESTVYTPIRSLLREYQFDGCFLGLRSEESEGRANTAKYHGSLYRYKRDDVLRCLPIADWSYRDVWAFIVQHNLDYNRVYDKMWDMPEDDRRVSYWAGETKVRWGRWIFLKREYPQIWNTFAKRFPEVREYV